MTHLLAIVLAVALLPAGGALAAVETDERGWAGPDLDGARKQALRNDQPVLVFLRKPRCRPCDAVERLLKHDAEIAPLTEPYIRLTADLTDEDGKLVAWNLRARVVPAVILLGPEGLEATRRERRIERRWLVEQLQMVVYRHDRKRAPVEPTDEALLAELDRLESWGDREGVERLLDRLARPRPASAAQEAPPLLYPSGDPVESRRDIARFLDLRENPADIRDSAFRLALALESDGQAELAMDVLQEAMVRLGTDPITAARAGFLASRHDVRIEAIRQQLMAARQIDPRSIPQLMALARVAERTGRVFQALHVVEAARVYAPDDPWIAVELRRLELLTHLRSRKAPAREPA